MFDFHMHTTVSFDGHGKAEDMVAAAEKIGLREMCFTDHIDYDPLQPEHQLGFETEDYNAAYDHLCSDTVKIRKGIEFGLLPDNGDMLRKDIARRPFDFVIGSVHFAEGLDPYFEPFWQGKTIEQAELCYLENVLACVQAHDDFDVLGHLTFISKAWANPTKRPVLYDNYRQIVDEIFSILAQKEKGLEFNTSGVDPCGVYLPSVDYIQRFKELGGRIVTVGSDAHDPARVGKYCHQACQIVKEIFGYVCTFDNRRPIFHRD